MEETSSTKRARTPFAAHRSFVTSTPGDHRIDGPQVSYWAHIEKHVDMVSVTYAQDSGVRGVACGNRVTPSSWSIVPRSHSQTWRRRMHCVPVPVVCRWTLLLSMVARNMASSSRWTSRRELVGFLGRMSSVEIESTCCT